MTDFQLASLITEIVIGLAWIGVIYYGIYRYEKSNDEICAAMEQDLQRYPEHTAVSPAQKEQSQELQAAIRSLDATNEALHRQPQALKTQITRTGGKGTA